jgi:class 3 adenylate cyclase
MTPAAVASPPRTADGAIVFTDLTGFSEFTAISGDEAALTLLSAQERTIRDALDRRGRIVKNLGDGFLLWFRDACAAIETCLTLQETFESQSFEQDLPIWVRIGIHYGHPLRHGRDIVGHDVNIAARIVDLAQTGEVLVSQACTEAMRHELPGVYFEEVGPAVMKGIPEAVTLYRAISQP